ncbi:RNA-directed DNA polymerase, eukaryota, reverse transcriptase zinc-binding domain protein, partial [Tanacetum coccineum]
DCFYRALTLRINMTKSKLMRIAVDEDRVEQAALKIECVIIKIGKKAIWVKWNNVLASKEKGGLGVQAYMVIKAIHGDDEKISQNLKSSHTSIWRDIVQELEVFKTQRWVWSLEGSGDFSVASIRKLIDDKRLPDVSSKTQWIKAVPIKVNVHAWKARLDCLPTRINISHRGMDIDSILCPICGNAVESSRHLFFDCHVIK